MKWLDVLLRRQPRPGGDRVTKKGRVDDLEREAQKAVQDARNALADGHPRDVARLGIIDAQIANLRRSHRWN